MTEPSPRLSRRRLCFMAMNRLIARIGGAFLLAMVPGPVEAQQTTPGESPTGAAAVTSDPVFRARMLDGTTLTGRIERLSSGGSQELSVEAGRSLPLNTVVSLVRETEPARTPPSGAQAVFPDGDRLIGLIGSVQEATIGVRPAWLGETSLKVPLESLLGLVLASGNEADGPNDPRRRVRTEPRAGEAVWLANGDRLLGSLLGITAEKVDFQPDTGAVALARGTVLAVGFDPTLVRYPRPDGLYLEVALNDGSRIGLRDARADHGRIVAQTRFGAEVAIPLSAVVRVDVRSRAVEYLSDRAADGVQYVGYLGDHPKVYGRGTTWDGHDLVQRGRPYDRGLGTVPRTLLAYRLEPAARRFQATVGLDDRSGEMGNVVFRVLVDGQPRWSSPPMGPGAVPVDVNVDVAGGKILILATEFGDRGDIQDSADWIEARLIRD